MGDCISTTLSRDGCEAVKTQETQPGADEHIDRQFLDDTADKLITGFIHFGGSNNAEKNSLCHSHIPRDILWLISQYHLQTLLISQYTFCTLESGQEYILDELKLEQYSMLTTKPFDAKTGEGGILIIKCKGPVIIEKGASINMNGKGYPPSHYGVPNENIKLVNGKVLAKNKQNFLFVKENKIICDSKNEYGLKLGKGYKHMLNSDPLITGGNGAGAVYIECEELHMNGGNIVCCGEKGFTRNPRCSSSATGCGGSVKIIIKSVNSDIGSNSKILSKGIGISEYDSGFSSSCGAVEIKCPLQIRQIFRDVIQGDVKYEVQEKETFL